MPAYLFANVEVTDPAGYEQYRQRVSATLARRSAVATGTRWRDRVWRGDGRQSDL